jgi:ABC-type lipoprotein release transport system permease subunit
VLAILLVMALIAGVLPAIRAVAIRPVQAIQNN